MKKIYDKDLGIDCDFVATGKSEEEVVRVSIDHIKKTHPVEFVRVKQMMTEKIKEENEEARP